MKQEELLNLLQTDPERGIRAVIAAFSGLSAKTIRSVGRFRAVAGGRGRACLRRVSVGIQQPKSDRHQQGQPCNLCYNSFKKKSC